MAIKIKKKDPNQGDAAESEEEVADPGAAAAAAQLSGDADPFLRASWETASWVEENRGLVIGAVLAVFVAIVGGYMGLGFLENQQVQASAALTPAFDSYNTMLDGSKELEAIESNPDIEAPKKTYKTDEARWQSIYDEASAALGKHPNADVALAAKLTKASAAAKLGQNDEAIKLYQEYLGATTDPAMKSAARHGLATAYAAAEKWDDALKELDALAEANEQYANGVRLQKARILEHAGKAEEAKKLYHEVLDEEPQHPDKADIERRLANM